MRELTQQEAKSGYTNYFGFNPHWRKQQCICGYEHCVELMPVAEQTTEKTCSIFVHNCPGGKETVQKCVVMAKAHWRRLF